MTTTPKKKGPASPASDPSYVTENLAKGKAMNAHMHITQLVPFPGQTPAKELGQVVIRLRIIGKLVKSRHSFDLEDIIDLQALLYQAMDTLEPVSAFLSDLEYQEGHQERFVECRRRWFIKRALGAAS